MRAGILHSERAQPFSICNKGCAFHTLGFCETCPQSSLPELAAISQLRFVSLLEIVMPQVLQIAAIAIATLGTGAAIDGKALATDERGGSVCLNSFEPFFRWLSRSVKPRPGLVATG